MAEPKHASNVLFDLRNLTRKLRRNNISGPKQVVCAVKSQQSDLLGYYVVFSILQGQIQWLSQEVPFEN